MKKEQIIAILEKWKIDTVFSNDIIHLINADDDNLLAIAEEIHEHYLNFFRWFLWQDEINREAVGKDRKGEIFVYDYDNSKKTVPQIYDHYVKNVMK